MAIERAPEIEKLLSDAYAAFQRGDPSPLVDLFSRDESVALLASEPDEVTRGHDAIASVLRRDAEGREAAPPMAEAEDVLAYRDGDFGWAVVTIRFAHPDDHSVPFRGTAVFRREDAAWRIVQWTVAVLVPDAAIASGWPPEGA